MTGLIIFTIYAFIMMLVSRRNEKKRKKRLQQLQQTHPTRLPKAKQKRHGKKVKSPKKTPANADMEAVWKDLMKQAKAKTQKFPRPKKKSPQLPQPIPPTENEVFSYDDLYEEEGYKETDPLKSTTSEQFTQKLKLPAAYDKKKQSKKGFKFNAKDAIIYEVIMKRKYK